MMNKPTWARQWTNSGWASVNGFTDDRLDQLATALSDALNDVQNFRSMSNVERASNDGRDLDATIRHKIPSILFL